MIAFFWNLSPIEIAVVVILAVLVFGKRLPQVAGDAFRQMGRFRRYLDELRRESGIDREIYNVKSTFTGMARDIESQPTASRPYPGHPGTDDRREEPARVSEDEPLTAESEGVERIDDAIDVDDDDVGNAGTDPDAARAQERP